MAATVYVSHSVNTANLLHGDVTDGILGAFYFVGGKLGYGFLETVYHAAMHLELVDRGLEVRSNVHLPVRYKGRVVGDFKADMIVEGKVLVETKAMRAIDASAEAQLMNYLRASELEVGLILNFGPRLEFRRRILEKARNTPRDNRARQPLDDRRNPRDPQ